MEAKRNKNLILYLFTFGFFGVFYYFLPFSGDDWTWGSDLAIERLMSGFDGYNGRYLGNFLIIIFMRSVVAKVIICSLIMFLLILILSKIFDNISGSKSSTNNYLFAVISVLILVLPNQIAFGEIQPFQIFGSTIGWLSGFSNYVVPSVLILIFYYYVTNKSKDSRLINIMLFIDGILACLCVEHYTLFCLIFSFSIIAYRYYHYKKICKKSVAFLLGSFVGALIMFTNSSYLGLKKEDDNQLRAVGFFGSFKQYATYVFGENANKILVVIFEFALLTGIVAFLIFYAKKVYKAIFSRNVSRLLPMICVVVMTLPLLFTNSGKEIYIVAPRCYFLQYFLIVIYAFRGFVEKKDLINKPSGKKLGTALKISFVALVLVTTAIYARLDYVGMIRDNKVNEALENNYQTVEVLDYPKGAANTQWASNSVEKDIYLYRYVIYKDIPDDKNVEIVTEY